MTRIETLLTAISKPVAAVLCGLMSLSLVGMFLCVAIQVFARSVLSTSYLWLDDILLFGFTISIFAGIALIFRTGQHLRSTLLADSLPAGASRVIYLAADLVTVAAMLGLAYQSIEFVRGAFGQFSPVLRLPLGWVYLILPLSAVASVLFVIENRMSGKDSPE